MEMTDYEIMESYRNAKYRDKQIGILADLNNCSKAKIKKILEKGDDQVKALPDEVKNEVASELRDGHTIEEVAQNNGIGISTTRKIKREAGLTKPREKKVSSEEPVGVPEDIADIIDVYEKYISDLEEKLSKLKASRDYLLSAFKMKG